MEEPIVVAELRQREHPWQKPEKYIVHMSDGEAVTYVPERTCTFSRCLDDEDPLPTCSACGYEADVSEVGAVPGGELCYLYKHCVDCGAKVVEE